MKNKNFVLFFIIIIFFFLFFFNQAFEKDNILFGSDTISISYPFKIFAKEVFLKYHTLPVWMSHIFFGIPLIDSTNLIFFYPTDFIFYFLPVPVEKTYFVDFLIHLLLAFLGMYLFLKILELKEESAILGGLFYLFSGIMVSFAYVGHFGNIKAAALIPFIFYFIKKGLKEEKLFYFLTAGLFFGLQILAIGMQIMAYTYLIVFFYLIYEVFFNIKDKQKIVKFFSFFLITTIVAICLSALQFFQSSGYTGYSWRANFKYENFISWSFHPIEIITFFLPQFFGLKDATYWGDYGFNQTTYYIGVLPFLFILFSFKIKKYKNYSIFLSFMSLLFLFLSYGGYCFLYKIFYYIPVFNNFRNPSRFLYIFTFTLITLSAIGFNNLLLNYENKISEDINKKNNFFYFIVASGIIIFFLILIGTNERILQNLLIAINNLLKRHSVEDKFVSLLPMIKNDIFVFIFVISIFILITYLILQKKIKNIFIVFSIFILLHCFDVLRIEKNFILFTDLKQFTFSCQFFEKFFKEEKPFFRIANFSNIWYPPNMNILSKIDSISGYHGLVPDKYYKLLENQIFNNVFVNNIFNVKYYIINNEINSPDFIKLYDGNGIKIYKNKNAKERFIFYDKIRKFDDEKTMLGYLKQLKKEPDEALVFDDINLKQEEGLNKYSIEIVKYMPHQIDLKVNTEKKGILFISNMYYPQWLAKINNKPTKIYEVNFAGMGVLLEKGENNVKFIYDIKKIIISLFITIFTLLIYIFVLIKNI